MDKTNGFQRLIIFIVILIVGVVFASLGSFIPVLIEGISLDEIKENPAIMMEKLSPSGIRLSLLIQHLFLFILPAILYGFYIFRKNGLVGMDLGKSPHVMNILLGLVLLLVAYPLVNFVHYINSLIPLADWMVSSEAQVAETLNKILNSKSPFVLVINILLVALMPALGEELVFRGILQKNLSKILKNPHFAIWLAATIFSGIHLQFEGFFARIMLGAIMGYSYYFTRNLWVPIIIHFMNNLIPVLAFMILGKDLTETTNIQNEFSWISLIIPILGVPALIYLFLNQNKKDDGFWA